MLLFLGPLTAGAQVSVKGSNATFFGLDFTQAKMSGFGRIYQSLRNCAWPFQGMERAHSHGARQICFGLRDVFYDFDISDKRNTGMNPDALVTNNSYRINEAAVADILKKCHRLQPVWEGSKKK